MKPTQLIADGIVSQCGVEDAPKAVVDGHQHRLVFAGAVGGWIGVGRSQQRHLLGGPSQAVIEFVLGMHPLGG